MSDESRRVLDLLAQQKISVDDAHRLLMAINEANARPAAATADAANGPADKSAPKYVRINVHKTREGGERDRDVNIRVPVSFLRSGMRLGAIVPGLGDHITAKARERGVDLDLSKFDAARIDTMLRDLGEMTIDVDGGRKQVRIFCE